jgi:hypothetical protein
MQQVGELALQNLRTPTQNSEPQSRVFSRDEIVLINYVFFRASNVYQNFKLTYPDDQSLKMAKREWGGRIIRRNREDLESAFENLKSMIGKDRQFDYFCPARLLSLCPSRKACHQQFALPKLANPTSKADGQRRLANLKALLE